MLSEPASSSEGTPLPTPIPPNIAGQTAIAPLAEVETVDPTAEEDFALVEPQPRSTQNVQV